VDPTNLCGVYKNTVSIYGRHLTEIGEHLLSQIKDALNGEQDRLAKDGLVRLTALDSLTLQTNDYGTSPSGLQALSLWAKIGVVVVIIAMIAGATTFGVYVYLERQSRQRRSIYNPQGKKISSNNTVGCEEEASHVSETVGLRGGTAVFLEDGRPVVIEFDKEARRVKDAIEEDRSECNSTVYSQSTGVLSAPQYIPRSLMPVGSDGVDEEKEPEECDMMEGTIQSQSVQPADPMSHSVLSFTEYPERTARSGAANAGEFT
jgi:hypothetical protein